MVTSFVAVMAWFKKLWPMEQRTDLGFYGLTSDKVRNSYGTTVLVLLVSMLKALSRRRRRRCPDA